MVQAIINIKEHTNQVLNIIKAKHNLRDKSEAINIMADQYEKRILEPTLRPEYIEKAKKIMKQKAIDIKTTDNLRNKLDL